MRKGNSLRATRALFSAALLISAASCGNAGGDGGQRGGSSSGGRASASAGQATGGLAGSSSGDPLVAGAGQATSSGAGSDAGGAGSGAACGDGVTQAGEECDDGNDAYGDGCFHCRDTKGCDTCWDPRAPGSSDVCGLAVTESDGSSWTLGDQCFGTDPKRGGLVIKNGPGAGSTRAQLCSALVSCAFEHGCSASADDLASRCWCGRSDGKLTDCDVDTATGPCKKPFEAAAESPYPNGLADWVQLHLADLDVSLGWVTTLLQCQSQCEQCGGACASSFHGQPATPIAGSQCTPFSQTGCAPEYTCDATGTACAAVACPSPP